MASPGKLDRSQPIGEICKEFSVTPRAVRFYEDMGLLAPRREGVTRMFSRREKARLRMILTGKRMRLSIRDIADILSLRDEDDGNEVQRHAALELFRRQLDLLLRQRAEIDEAMEMLRQACETLEGEVAPTGGPNSSAAGSFETMDRSARRASGPSSAG
ncbi:MAG: MerR family DNA-binding transcriptional regulator [Caulobacter sp.]|nr:MerR family DNA-binding transcriptional regulator [Caulobacter sp.]